MLPLLPRVLNCRSALRPDVIHPPSHDGKTYRSNHHHLSRARSLLRSTMDGMPSHLCDKGGVNVIRMKVRDKLLAIAIDLRLNNYLGSSNDVHWVGNVLHRGYSSSTSFSFQRPSLPGPSRARNANVSLILPYY